MPKVKNKDGSINWDEIEINPIINTIAINTTTVIFLFAVSI